MGTIVVGYDHSEGARLALRTAEELAKQFSDRLVIAYGFGASPRTGEELRAHNEALEELGREATDEGLANAKQAGVDAEVALVAERPAAALLSLAEYSRARVARYVASALRSRSRSMIPGYAHVGGVPVEEAVAALLPVGVALLAGVRLAAHRLRSWAVQASDRPVDSAEGASARRTPSL